MAFIPFDDVTPDDLAAEEEASVGRLLGRRWSPYARRWQDLDPDYLRDIQEETKADMQADRGEDE